MKIAIINKYQFKVNRGAETYVSELAKRLSQNHEVDILTKLNWNKKYDLVIPTNGRLQVFMVRILTWIRGARMIVSGQSTHFNWLILHRSGHLSHSVFCI